MDSIAKYTMGIYLQKKLNETLGENMLIDMNDKLLKEENTSTFKEFLNNLEKSAELLKQKTVVEAKLMMLTDFLEFIEKQ